MKTTRMEAFTDGVIAIIITITVLEMRVPHGASFAALKDSAPVFLVYALSFINVGIYWANHHHMLQAVERIDGHVLWANLFLLFWLSLAPFVIRWMDDERFAALPTAAYGFIFAMAAVGYTWTQAALIRRNGKDSALARGVGRDWKGKLSLVGYLAAMLLAFVAPWIALTLYVAIAAMWLIPDRRVERSLHVDRPAG